MSKREGMILLGLVILITVLALSSMVGVLEQDTRLKRFREDELKLNLSAIRRGIDLYRYKYSVSAPDPAKVAALEAALAAGTVDTLVGLLAAESFIRARVATGTMEWRTVTNLVKNPSFEIDNGTIYGSVNVWQGNALSGDGVPDGWGLHADGVEQVISLAEADTYVLSLWCRVVGTGARARVQVWSDEALPLIDFYADESDWKRYFASFSISSASSIRLVLSDAGADSGELAYIDGVMLERWNPPAGTPADAAPVASAWTKSTQVVPSQGIEALQQRQFSGLIPEDADPASVAWWFQW